MKKIATYAKKTARTFGASLNHQVSEDWLDETERASSQKKARALHKKVMLAVCKELTKMARRM